MGPPTAPRTARARARSELTHEIKSVARGQLAEHGAAQLSLRAVSREMGMVSSALYRYFPDRDSLLSALIVDAYTALGVVAEHDEATVRRTDYRGRWLAITRAARQWALANRHEFELIFGTPVPGYRAPPDTVDPAARIPLLLMAIVSDAKSAGRLSAPPSRPIPRSVRDDLRALRAAVAPILSELELAHVAQGWTMLVGGISFELFGHLHNVVHDYPGYYDMQTRLACDAVGLP